MRFKVVPNQEFRGVNMNSNIEKNITIAYDENIITKIKELIKNGVEKLESFVKSKTKPDLSFYNELDEKFNHIAKNLEKYEFLDNEFNYFLSISSKILYIVRRNYQNDSFGHCDYALELFDFFMEILDAKINLINNFCEDETRKYEKIQTEFKARYWDFESEFYLNIYKSTGEFSEEELYKIHENLRK